jgi:HD-like signal output (HDOD) protein
MNAPDRLAALNLPALVDLGVLADCVRALPPFPEALIEVMRALEHGELSARRSIELIEHDQALAASTLRLANSAFYGAAGRVGSIGDAVRVLGLRTVAGVLTAATLHDTLRVDQCPEFDFGIYWRHAMASAVIARELASLARHDADEAFLAGLMHDVGVLVLAAYEPTRATAVLSLARERQMAVEQAESQLLGVAHPLVGGLVAQRWRFPASIVEAIERHHEPMPKGPASAVTLPQLIQATEAMAHALAAPGEPVRPLPPLALDFWHRLEQAPEGLLPLLAKLEEDAREMCRALRG